MTRGAVNALAARAGLLTCVIFSMLVFFAIFELPLEDS